MCLSMTRRGQRTSFALFGILAVFGWPIITIFKALWFSVVRRKQGNDRAPARGAGARVKGPSAGALGPFSYDWYESSRQQELGRLWAAWKQAQSLWWSQWQIRPSGVGAYLTLMCLVTASLWVYQFVFVDLPSPYSLRERHPIVSTKIYDRNGVLLYTLYKDENRTLVGLQEMSPHVIHATLAIEDANFYHHYGLSLKGLARAVWHNARNETTQGGSTITQQLVKNTLLTPERTLQRKVREAVLSVAVDAIYTKDEILEAYLNEVNYGGSVYGIEEASQWYFGKPAKELTLAESAFLAGLPAQPSNLMPMAGSSEPAIDRQKEVLWRMEQEGYITAQERDEAQSQPLALRSGSHDIVAPHFVMYVRSLLAEEYGDDMVTQGGLEVYTTLDVTVQATAEAAIAKELKRLEKLRVQNGAAMVTNPKSGEILAMVGSKDYFDRAHDGQVNVTLRPRQPGSSIKPVTYATAFERGFTPQSIIQDTPVTFTTAGSPPYSPKNYDGGFRGPVTLREALGSSYNVPAVRLLVEVGLQNVVQQGKAMGITTWDDPSRFGLSLTLGAGEVTMRDMAQVYGTFANGGVTVPLSPFREVRRYDGEVLYRNPCVDAVEPCNGKRVLRPLTAYHITSILTDNQARSPAFGPRSVLYIPNQEVAVKTGTTNSLRDNWTAGYTTDRVVMTWVGNNDNTPMSAVASGVTGASPIWRGIMNEMVASGEHHFAMPAGLEKVKICQSTGTLSCAECPRVTEEVFPEGMAPTRHCTAAMFANMPSPAPDQRTARLPL